MVGFGWFEPVLTEEVFILILVMSFSTSGGQGGPKAHQLAGAQGSQDGVSPLGKSWQCCAASS